MATSDVHGTLAPQRYVAKDGRAAVTADGVLALSAYVQNARAAHPGHVLLVDAGDLFQGTMAVNQSRGRAMVEAYNALGYDAAAIGNHEFDYGPDPNRPGSPTGALEAAIAGARFPFLAANIDDRVSGALPAWPNLRKSALLVRGGMRVGIIGVSTPTTPSATLGANVRDLSFAAAAPRVAAEAAHLRAAGAELVVLLGHMGGRCEHTKNAFDLSSCAMAFQEGLYGELFAVLRALPPGTVDVAIGGHTHEKVAHWVGSTAVLQSGAYGRFMGRVDACILPQGGIDAQRSQIYAPKRLCLSAWQDGTCGARTTSTAVAQARYENAPLRIDPAVQAAVQPHLDAVIAREQEPLRATLPDRLPPAQLAQLTAEGLRRSLRADFGLQNRGGVRSALAAGPLRYGDLFRAVPFDNRAVRIMVTGRQLATAVQRIAQSRPPSDWPKLSGLTLKRNGGKVVVQTSKGAPLDPDRRYALATCDFLLAGGDGAADSFASVAPADVQVQASTLRDSLAALLIELFPTR